MNSSSAINTYLSSGTSAYADGTTFSGTFVLDTLSIGGKINLTKFKFINAQTVTRHDLDGIVGMAFPYDGASGDNMIARLLEAPAGVL